MSDAGPSPTTQAVILARGLGTRMRRESADQGLSAVQLQAAAAGAKGMMPLFARPFLDYVISALADAAITDVVLVVGPAHDAVREYYTNAAPPARVRIRFAVQAEPKGTADAVYAVRDAVNDASFLMLNSDNYYPVAAYSALAAVGGAGLIAFEADTLVRDGGIQAERVLNYALVDFDSNGWLREICEKPPSDHPLAQRAERWVSMNLWSFTPRIFDACARIKPSQRGELELADAVMVAMRDVGERFRVIPMRGVVLDLSSRADVAFVSTRLADVTPNP